jgi:hypothetical protein
MRTTLRFIWANDHEHRASLFEYDPIPSNFPLPRVGDRVFLNDAKDKDQPESNESTGSYDSMIVAEVEFGVYKDSYSVDVVLRDPDPEEFADGAWKTYPEYAYDSQGGYVMTATHPSHRYPKHEKIESTKEEDNAV